MNVGRLSLACLLLGSPAVMRGSDSGRLIGHVNAGKSPEYRIMTELGIEQVERGKLTTHRYQVWWLSCSFPDSIGRESGTSCSLERTVFDRYQDDYLKTVVSSRTHHTGDGTLRITLADWRQGSLHFSLIHPDGTTTEVMLLMKYQKVAGSTMIYLTSFKAVGIGGVLSGTLEAIEYRIPKYTYTLNLPVVIRGMKSEEDKELDEMISSLSHQDRLVYERLKDGPDLFDLGEVEGELKRIAPDLLKARRDPTPKELEVIWFQVFEAKLLAKLAAVGMSKDGQKKVADHVSRGVLRDLKRAEVRRHW